MGKTRSPDERAAINPVKNLIPARSHISCPRCGESMSWECKPEVENRDGFPVATGTFWGKIWCRCGLVWKANPWPRAGIALHTTEPVEKPANPLKKYHGGARVGNATGRPTKGVRNPRIK